MIIAWTLFIIFAPISLVMLIGAVYMTYVSFTDSFDDYGEVAAGYTFIAIIFVILTAIAAQYIWGGGF